MAPTYCANVYCSYIRILGESVCRLSGTVQLLSLACVLVIRNVQCCKTDYLGPNTPLYCRGERGGNGLRGPKTHRRWERSSAPPRQPAAAQHSMGPPARIETDGKFPTSPDDEHRSQERRSVASPSPLRTGGSGPIVTWLGAEGSSGEQRAA